MDSELVCALGALGLVIFVVVLALWADIDAKRDEDKGDK